MQRDSRQSCGQTGITKWITVLTRVFAAFVSSLVLAYELAFRVVRNLVIRQHPEMAHALHGWSIGNPEGPSNPTVYWRVVWGAGTIAICLAIIVAIVVFRLTARRVWPRP